jgi:hypothetical protein
MKQTSIFDEFSGFIAGMNPEKVIAFKASPAHQHRLDSLLEKQRDTTLTAEERSEVEQYLMLNRIVGLAKARAIHMLRA